jgi:mono/diheme cytochrome c family protein
MLPVLLFILFWVVLGVSLTFVALRGGASGARESLHTQTPRARHAAAGLFAVLFVVLGIAIPALLLASNHADAGETYAGAHLSRDDRKGREIFQISCSSCHTLEAAKAAGKVGPNLDDLKPPKSLVLDALAKGRLRGNGNMPAQIVQGQDAEYVADFVSKVAGR